MFTVETSPRFERLARKLRKQHPEFIEFYREAINVLELDPYNQTHQYVIKKLNWSASDRWPMATQLTTLEVSL